jgi:hypothetical protein
MSRFIKLCVVPTAKRLIGSAGPRQTIVWQERRYLKFA